MVVFLIFSIYFIVTIFPLDVVFITIIFRMLDLSALIIRITGPRMRAWPQPRRAAQYTQRTRF